MSGLFCGIDRASVGAQSKTFIYLSTGTEDDWVVECNGYLPYTLGAIARLILICLQRYRI